MFDELVISVAKRRPTHTRWAFLVSLAGELSALGILSMIPTIGIQALPSGWREMSLLPPALSTAPPVAQATTNNQTQPQHLMTVAPFAPPHATIIHDPAPPAIAGNPGPLQLPGAIPGVGGDNPWTSILTQGSPGPPFGAPVLRVGGQVQAAKLIHLVRPEYPMDARKAHVQGAVILGARIAKDGTVVALRYINGPIALVPAVEEAVSQWRYMPTLLNGEPMEVETTITVIFRLLPAKKAKHSAGKDAGKEIGSGG